MARGEMVYNSQKEDLLIPEYGRNVQNMVRFLKDIEDKELRTAYAEEIVNPLCHHVPRQSFVGRLPGEIVEPPL
ncbi:MAG: DUF4290 domain-containing protein [Saprospiraceae bacterium]|nr:DUF4290 domain-containing protein [Saprospiraceae bacterium]